MQKIFVYYMSRLNSFTKSESLPSSYQDTVLQTLPCTERVIAPIFHIAYFIISVAANWRVEITFYSSPGTFMDWTTFCV